MVKHKQLFQFDNITTWSQSKSGDEAKNEDQVRSTSKVITIADGATDKTGFVYLDGLTGGRHLAELVAETAVNSAAIGAELSALATREIRELYIRDNPAALTDPGARAATTLVSAVIRDDQLHVTQIGDTNFRVTFTGGETEQYSNDKLVDDENASLRQAAIKRELELFVRNNNREPNEEEKAAIIANGRGVILDRLKIQYLLQNSSSDSLHGYGTLDGSPLPDMFDDGTPTNYIKTYQFNAADVRRVEIASDGFYGVFPEESTIDAYQNLHHEIHAKDPDKFLRYLSTKSTDDASVIIANPTSHPRRK